MNRKGNGEMKTLTPAPRYDEIYEEALKHMEEGGMIFELTHRSRLFLPALRSEWVIAFSLGVMVAIVALTAGLFFGFDGYFKAVILLMLGIVGLTPWLMDGLWERIKR